MNKEELIKLLEELNFPKEKFYILSSGCLTFYGIRDGAKDLDLCITEELFDQIKDKYGLTEGNKNECGFYKINDLVEVVVDSLEEFAGHFDIKDGYQVQKLEIIKRDKEKRGLPKDLADVARIEEYIKARAGQDR
ncbi:MAG: hypothetical protein IJV31_02455 [Clostridia bacterium]|nr:hypothetical protein [Clostridia bacterium]